MLTALTVNREASIREQEISERHSCVIVDDFLRNPEDLRSYAQESIDQFSIPERSYPGMVLDINSSPMADVYRYLRSSMSRRLGFMRGGVQFSTMLSLTTLQPEELSNLQRLCHTDPRSRLDRENYASVLYLFDNPELGGTAFYRWKEKAAITEATALDIEDPGKALQFLKSRFASFFRLSVEILTELRLG